MRPAATLLIGAALVIGCAGETPPVAPPPPPPPPILSALEPAPPPPPAPAPKKGRVRATEFKVEGGILAVPGQVVFETNSDKLSPQSDEVLEFVHDFLDAKPEVTLRIEGHTDSDGNVANNQVLSEKRALAVARWLVGVGVKCDRLVAVGFGHTKPFVPNDTPENKAQNRRMVFAPAALRGRAIGGMPIDGGGKVAGDVCH